MAKQAGFRALGDASSESDVPKTKLLAFPLSCRTSEIISVNASAFCF